MGQSHDCPIIIEVTVIDIAKSIQTKSQLNIPIVVYSMVHEEDKINNQHEMITSRNWADRLIPIQIMRLKAYVIFLNCFLRFSVPS